MLNFGFDLIRRHFFVHQVLDIAHMDEQISYFKQQADEIKHLSTRQKVFSLFELQTGKTKDQLVNIALKNAERRCRAVNHSIEVRSAEVLTAWQQTHVKVLATPQDEEEVARLKQMMSDIHVITDPLMATSGHIRQQMELLEKFDYRMKDDTVEAVFRTTAGPAQTRQDMSEAS